MMSLQDIIKKIRTDAEARAAKIAAAARQEAEEIKKAAASAAAAAEKEIAAEAEALAEREQRRILSKARLDGKKKVLAARRQALDRALGRAGELLAELEDDEARGMWQRALLAEAAAGTETVYVGEKERERITDSFIDGVNKKLSENGRQGKLRLETRKDLPPGFILRGEKMLVDCTFPSLLLSVRDEAESAAAQELFKEEKDTPSRGKSG